jgi:hypothetical protein
MAALSQHREARSKLRTNKAKHLLDAANVSNVLSQRLVAVQEEARQHLATVECQTRPTDEQQQFEVEVTWYLE